MDGRSARAARRLTVCLVLIAGGVALGAPAPAATTTVAATPQETTLAQFTLLDVWVSSNWEAGGQVVIELNGTQVASGLTGSNGSYISGDVPVPAGVAFCGSNEVDWYSFRDFVASANITVYCPTVQATPNPVQASGGSYPLTLSGSGYPAVRYVNFTLDGSPTPFDGTYTDGNGAFTKSTAIPAVPCGTHQITATAQTPVIPQIVRAGPTSTVPTYRPLPASTTFTVTGCPTPSASPTPTTPPLRGAPKLTANPDVISDGMLTHVTGTGFPDNVPITLVWASADGTPLVLCSPDAISAPPLSSDAAGNLDTYCMAPPHELFGAMQIWAVPSVVNSIALPPTSAAHVAAPVVVEGGSMQPSSGDQLVFRR